MSLADPFYDVFPMQSDDGWDPFKFLQAPDSGVVHGVDTTPVPAPLRPDESPDESPEQLASSERQLLRPGSLLCSRCPTGIKRRHSEDPTSCIHYSTEWKVTVNNKVVSKGAEQNVVLAPGSYWQLFLQPKLEKSLRRHLPHNKCVRSDDTNVVVSVTEHSERDLTKRYDDAEVDWSVVEKKLVTWGELFHAGKKR
jgi:hypothetical protein